MMTFTNVYNFWFVELKLEDWFAKRDSLDQEIRARFLHVHKLAKSGELSHWRSDPRGRLCEVIVLDQFSRNMFRDTPEAFASDLIALRLAQDSVQSGDDLKLTLEERPFIYMPYMHSEDKNIHEVAVQLFDQPGLESSLKFELLHKKIIDDFGRYPHRNKILGRASTSAELEFLTRPGSQF